MARKADEHLWKPKLPVLPLGGAPFLCIPEAISATLQKGLATFNPQFLNRIWKVPKGILQQLRFGVFREGVFQKMPALEGQFLKEIAVRFAGENHLRTQKNTPLPKDPFFQLLDTCQGDMEKHPENTLKILRIDPFS